MITEFENYLCGVMINVAIIPKVPGSISGYTIQLFLEILYRV